MATGGPSARKACRARVTVRQLRVGESQARERRACTERVEQRHHKRAPQVIAIERQVIHTRGGHERRSENLDPSARLRSHASLVTPTERVVAQVERRELWAPTQRLGERLEPSVGIRALPEIVDAAHGVVVEVERRECGAARDGACECDQSIRPEPIPSEGERLQARAPSDATGQPRCPFGLNRIVAQLELDEHRAEHQRGADDEGGRVSEPRVVEMDGAQLDVALFALGREARRHLAHRLGRRRLQLF